jgi:hypothetical protein
MKPCHVANAGCELSRAGSRVAGNAETWVPFTARGAASPGNKPVRRLEGYSCGPDESEDAKPRRIGQGSILQAGIVRVTPGVSFPAIGRLESFGWRLSGEWIE